MVRLSRHDRLVQRAGDALEYVSRPERGTVRYVFKGMVCRGIASAECYVSQLEEETRGKDSTAD